MHAQADEDDCNCDGGSANDGGRRRMCCGLSSFFVFILLFAMSWDTLEPTEYGIVQNGFTGYVDLDPKNVYSGGRYFIWLRHYFLVFPRNLRSLEFDAGGRRPPIPARTGCAAAARHPPATHLSLARPLSSSTSRSLARHTLAIRPRPARHRLPPPTAH